ncbi:hypothetical protein GGP46_003043 [Salinibacter ruber]|nr:hypothetical protein [Salinibacter ruber]
MCVRSARKTILRMAKSLKPLTVVPLSQSRLGLEEKRLGEKSLEESHPLETIPSLKRS